MEDFFTKEELKAPNVNVYGRVPKGNECIKENTRSLDQDKISNIKRIVLEYVEDDAKIKLAVWKCCITAMNQKMSAIRKQNYN